MIASPQIGPSAVSPATQPSHAAAPVRSGLRIGIDLGGTKIEGVVMDDDGRIVHRERRSTPTVDGYAGIVNSLSTLVHDLDRAAGTRCPVGIGTPGAVSAVTGRMKNCNTTCLNGQRLTTDLEAQIGPRVRIENDANCFALSEARDGAGANAHSVFGVILGTGVGGGIVIGGSLLRGAQHIAGEWGHNPLDPAGPRCYCGRRGCVETLLAGPALARDYQTRGGAGGCDAVVIAARANQGDTTAVATLNAWLENFGRALATVINILDPDTVVLGGGLSNIDAIVENAPRHVKPHVFNNEFRTPIVRNRHGDSSGVRGAAWLWPTPQTTP